MLRGLVNVSLSIVGIMMGVAMILFVPVLGSVLWLGLCFLLLVIGLEQFFTGLGRKLNGENSQEDHSDTTQGSR